MDEPTAALGASETEQLHAIVRSLAEAGRTVLLVSHFLREVLALADAVTILRDGRVVRTAPTAGETEESLIQAMLGRPLTAAFPPRRPAPDDAPAVLAVRDLRAPGVDGVSLSVRAGEIVALAGLVGAGRTELARAVFGADRVTGGEVEVAGGHRLSGGPRAAAAGRRGDDPRVAQGGRPAPRALRHRERQLCEPRCGQPLRAGAARRRAPPSAEALDRWTVRASGYGAPVASLSGGNQQKVLFARMLLCTPDVLIADEPTRGVDVGARRAIYDLLVGLAAEAWACCSSPPSSRRCSGWRTACS